MANRFHSLAFAAGAAVLSSIAVPATAESITRDANCYFFRDETLEIIDTCELHTEGLFEEGSITHYLTWPDGVVTTLEVTEECGWEYMVDGQCGTTAFRSYGTFERLSDDDLERHVEAEAPYLTCADVGDNSVCWDPLQDI